MPGNRKVYLPASVTVEASLVIPLFIFAVMSVIYFMQIIGVQIKMQQALYNESRKIAKYAHLQSYFNKEENSTYTGGDRDYQDLIEMGIGFISAHAMLVSELGEDYILNASIVGGKSGLNLTKSKFLTNNNEIELVVSYAIKNPFNIFGAPNIKFTQKAYVKAWTGDVYENKEDTEQNQQIVYITTHGSVYHTSKDCTYLKPSVMETSVELVDDQRNQGGGRYAECEKCKGQAGDKKRLYITVYGDRYHTTPNCSALYRNIISVKLSEINGMGKCVKCSEKDGEN